MNDQPCYAREAMAKKKPLAPLVPLDELKEFVAALIGAPKAADNPRPKPERRPKRND